MGRARKHCRAQQQPGAARRAKWSLWGTQEGKTCHHCSHRGSPGLQGTPQGWGSPGCPGPPALGVPNTLGVAVPAPSAAQRGGTGLLCPPRDPPPPGSHQSYLCLRRAGGVRGTPGSGLRRGQDAGRHLIVVPSGKSQKKQRGVPPAAVPAAPCLPRRPPHPGCALFACYFWQRPKSSSQAINNESAKFVWPLLYKER